MDSLGRVEPDTVEKVEVQVSEEELARQKRIEAKPPLSEILNLHDFEVCAISRPIILIVLMILQLQAIAKDVMSEKAWAYYSSAADDEITNRENHAAFHR